MEDEEFSRLSKQEFRKDRTLAAITFEYDGTVKQKFTSLSSNPETISPILVQRKNSKKVYWNGSLSKFSHVYVDNPNYSFF